MDPGEQDPVPAVEDPRAWPTTPFTAWTARGPVSIVAPGGATLALIDPAGVRVTVLQTLPVRVRVRCVGCPAPHQDVEGWLQADAIWWPGADTARPPGDPLTAGVSARIRWAAGQDAPAHADADGLCAMIDGGFQGQPAVWASPSARLSHDGAEGLSLTGLPSPAPGACALEPPAPEPARD
ncbi:MAG: hypothetical protein H6742_05155 [Alphaproteobacteria bacterium]|nr:hypothetical protein [Alphaproteobacteria bacterium]